MIHFCKLAYSWPWWGEMRMLAKIAVTCHELTASFGAPNLALVEDEGGSPTKAAAPVPSLSPERTQTHSPYSLEEQMQN